MNRTDFSRFFRGLSGQVLLWFMLIALAPLCITNWLNYQHAKEQLFTDMTSHLADTSRLQTVRIKETLRERQVNLEAETNRESTNFLMSTLADSYQESGKTAVEFTRGYKWATLVEAYAGDLNNYQYNDGHYNVLLIDTLGNILYSGFRKENLGENVFQGDLSHTRLASSTRQALDSGQMVFSDLELFGEKEQLAGFLVTPLLGEQGEKTGAIAVQLSGQKLLNIIGRGINFGATGKRYLVGADMTLRTPDALGEAFPVLQRKVETELVEKWHQEHLAPDAQNRMDGMREQVSIYEGPHGQRVLGLHTDIDVAGVEWAYIAELDEDEAFETSQALAMLTLEMLAIVIILVALVAFFLARSIVKPIVNISDALTSVGDGDLSQRVEVSGRYELKDLAAGFNSMLEKVHYANKAKSTDSWLQDGAIKLSEEIQSEQDLAHLSQTIISFLCRYLDAQIGAFYVVNDETIRLMGSYAFKSRKGFRNEFAFGEGMVGQAALEKQRLTLRDIPDDYLAISSGLGESTPGNIVILPVEWNDRVIALVEFGTTKEFSETHSRFLDLISSSIATAVQTAISRDKTNELLATTQVQAEELRVSEEELQESNSTLERQAQELKKSQAKLEERNEQLQSQQEELRVANEELEERADDLKNSRLTLETQNVSLETAKQELERKARELQISTKYKSEFLANMSHELRTPLNSLLILAGILAENKEGNLTEKQVSYSKTVYDSGNDLLKLLNEILDLAKVEAGKVDVEFQPIQRDEFIAELQRKFTPMAETNNVKFTIAADEAPDEWQTDSQKLTQIIRNLLSNAFKFTSEGTVTLKIGSVPENPALGTRGIDRRNALAFTVTDTGIGIPEDKQQVIFEAFQQADGSTSRKYGGTGLGLSICRELAKLLGGEIHLESEVGKGSSFSLVIPLGEKSTAEAETDKPAPPLQTTKTVSTVSEIADDRSDLKKGERSVLIIEDDPTFASIVKEHAKSQGFKVLVAEDGRTGLQLADYHQPSGIILDIGLPDIDGWYVIDYLKDNGRTRHIPVHFMSARDKSPDALKAGAIGFSQKPATTEEITGALDHIKTIAEGPIRKLLLVEDNKIQGDSLRELIAHTDVELVLAETGQAALDALTNARFDCMVLDLNLPDMTGIDVLKDLRSKEGDRKMPVVVYTARDLESREKETLERLAQRIITKDARSTERLLDDTTLFLHRLEANLPEEQREVISMLHNPENLFADRKVLLVDDDMRNIFSLSAILQEKKMDILTAGNGAEALETLDENPETAIVLMDIMMPVMDGYEAMRKIREQQRFEDLPIIALTAKAMKGDRALCIEAGASDYLSKPLNREKLLSMMRVWLYR